MTMIIDIAIILIPLLIPIMIYNCFENKTNYELTNINYCKIVTNNDDDVIKYIVPSNFKIFRYGCYCHSGNTGDISFNNCVDRRRWTHIEQNTAEYNNFNINALSDYTVSIDIVNTLPFKIQETTLYVNNNILFNTDQLSKDLSNNYDYIYNRYWINKDEQSVLCKTNPMSIYDDKDDFYDNNKEFFITPIGVHNGVNVYPYIPLGRQDNKFIYYLGFYD